jgi:hypothetical protein
MIIARKIKNANHGKRNFGFAAWWHMLSFQYANGTDALLFGK